MAEHIQIRRDTLANWNISTSILADGEMAIVQDENKVVTEMRFGTGDKKFSQLESVTASAGADGATGATGADGATYTLDGTTLIITPTI